MADGLDFSLDGAALDRDADRLVRRYLTAGTTAVNRTTKNLERNLEAATRASVPGRLWRAWASDAFPKSGPARNPVGQVFVNGGNRTRGALTFWTQPGEVRAKGGQYLAVPLPTAGARGRLRDLTPGEWERNNGQRLVFIYRQGKPSILAAIGTKNGRTGTFRPLTQTRTRKGRAGSNPLEESVIPIFVLLPMVRFRNAVAIQPMIAAAEADLMGEYLAVVSELG
jgi:hypothetical protein